VEMNPQVQIKDEIYKEKGPRRILVVDDDFKSRKVLKDLLEVQGYEVYEAEDGKKGLELINDLIPDAVLLDVMMPNIDGFEVCRIIKEDPDTTHIPVIMITALQDKESKLKGIGVGATDFISKPIDIKEVTLRVKNAVYGKKLYDEVNEAYRKLKELEVMRDSLFHMIVHDLRQPVTALSGYLQILKMHEDSFSKADQKIIEESYSVTNILIEMISSLLDVSKLEEGKLELQLTDCNLSTLVQDAVQFFDVLKGHRNIKIDKPDYDIICRCDMELVRRVLINLIGNAVKFTQDGGKIQVLIEETEKLGYNSGSFSGHSPTTSSFNITNNIETLKGEVERRFIKVSIKDNGPGISSKYHKKIFEKFGQVETRGEGKKYSTGLGLTFCKLVIEAHGGNIGVDSKPGEESVFWFIIPNNV